MLLIGCRPSFLFFLFPNSFHLTPSLLQPLLSSRYAITSLDRTQSFHENHFIQFSWSVYDGHIHPEIMSKNLALYHTNQSKYISSFEKDAPSMLEYLATYFSFPVLSLGRSLNSTCIDMVVELPLSLPFCFAMLLWLYGTVLILVSTFL
jgi:hypothetical protein